MVICFYHFKIGSQLYVDFLSRISLYAVYWIFSTKISANSRILIFIEIFRVLNQLLFFRWNGFKEIDGFLEIFGEELLAVRFVVGVKESVVFNLVNGFRYRVLIDDGFWSGIEIEIVGFIHINVIDLCGFIQGGIWVGVFWIYIGFSS